MAAYVGAFQIFRPRYASAYISIEGAQTERQRGGAARTDPAYHHQRPRHSRRLHHVGRGVRVAHQTGGGAHP